MSCSFYKTSIGLTGCLSEQNYLLPNLKIWVPFSKLHIKERFLQVVVWPPHVCYSTRTYTHKHTCGYINTQIKMQFNFFYRSFNGRILVAFVMKTWCRFERIGQFVCLKNCVMLTCDQSINSFPFMNYQRYLFHFVGLFSFLSCGSWVI